MPPGGRGSDSSVLRRSRLNADCRFSSRRSDRHAQPPPHAPDWSCDAGLCRPPLPVLSQPKPHVKVRYNEIARTILFMPTYVAIAKGYFDEVGLDVTVATAQGGDKLLAIMLSNQADIALGGPDMAIYVHNSDSPVKFPIFCGLISTDGWMLMGREKVDKFDWSTLKGKEILGFRPGSTPLLYLEAALRKNGLDPQKDVKLVNNIGMPARVGAWLAGQGQYAIFLEPEPSQLELDDKAHF